jgi:hypothetical protein
VGTWPIQAASVEMKTFPPVQLRKLRPNDSPWKRRPSPLSSRPERSAVEGPAVSFPQYSQPSGLFIARLAA